MRQRALMVTVGMVLVAGAASGPRVARGEVPPTSAQEDVAPADLLWERSQAQLYAGEHAAALVTLDRLIARYPESDAAARARRVRAQVQGLVAKHGEVPTTAGRMVLASAQLVHGFVLGANLCLLMSGCEDAGRVLTGLIGSWTLFGLAMGVAPHDTPLELAIMLDLGMVVGGMHGASRLINNETYTPYKALFGGTLGGMALGGAAYVLLRPTTTELAGAVSAAGWAQVMFGRYRVLFDEPDTPWRARTWLTCAGLLAGGLLVHHTAATRDQVFLVDALGLVGALGGYTVGAALAEGSETPKRTRAASVISGITLGLAAGVISAYQLSLSSDRARGGALLPKHSFLLMPEPGGASVGIVGRF